MTGDYQTFLESKLIRSHSNGITVNDSDIHEMLFPFQRDITKWACRKGKAAMFLDTGLGKALESNTPILTPTGFVPIKNLRIGDYVIGRDGKQTLVTGVFPQGKREGFNISFSDCFLSRTKS